MVFAVVYKVRKWGFPAIINMVTIYYCQLSLKVLNFSVLLVLSIMHVSRDLTAEALNHRIAQRGEREERGGGPAAVAVRRPSHALPRWSPGERASPPRCGPAPPASTLTSAAPGGRAV